MNELELQGQGPTLNKVTSRHFRSQPDFPDESMAEQQKESLGTVAVVIEEIGAANEPTSQVEEAVTFRANDAAEDTSGLQESPTRARRVRCGNCRNVTRIAITKSVRVECNECGEINLVGYDKAPRVFWNSMLIAGSSLGIFAIIVFYFVGP